jgi:hypothetical protein
VQTTEVLLITNSRDFAVDGLVKRLQAHGVSYARLDLDLLCSERILLDVHEPRLIRVFPSGSSQSIHNPSAILYRAPTHLRESSGHRYSSEMLLQRHQWAAFARSLSVFDGAYWMNSPVATYAAECKPFQLKVAGAVGLPIPRTAVSNFLPTMFDGANTIAVKALDSFLLRHNEEDLFFYTQGLSPSELTSEACQVMPMILQDYLGPKTDLRVTIVGDECFVAETATIVDGDWRLKGAHELFKPTRLPSAIERMCMTVVKRLGLAYAAIDLARVRDTYYFLELNPTGEWAWLDDTFDGQISTRIADQLASAGLA